MPPDDIFQKIQESALSNFPRNFPRNFPQSEVARKMYMNVRIREHQAKEAEDALKGMLKPSTEGIPDRELDALFRSLKESMPRNLRDLQGSSRYAEGLGIFNTLTKGMDAAERERFFAQLLTSKRFRSKI